MKHSSFPLTRLKSTRISCSLKNRLKSWTGRWSVLSKVASRSWKYGGTRSVGQNSRGNAKIKWSKSTLTYSSTLESSFQKNFGTKFPLTGGWCHNQEFLCLVTTILKSNYESKNIRAWMMLILWQQKLQSNTPYEHYKWSTSNWKP